MTTTSGEIGDTTCDICLFSLDVFDGVHARAKIYIIDGTLRGRLMTTIGIHRGLWCALLADRLGMIHVSKAIKQHHIQIGSPYEHIVPHLLYTWWMLDYCSMRVQRLVFGVNKMHRCLHCGTCSWWGLDAANRARCIACILGDNDALTRSPPAGIARSGSSQSLSSPTGQSGAGGQCRSHWQSH